MDATIGRRQADHERRALIDAWISTPTWAESRTFLIDHREALLADDMAELLASADHDTARQHLAILNLAAALPTEAVYGIITNPGTPKTPSLTPSKPATSHNSCRSSPPPGPASPNDP